MFGNEYINNINQGIDLIKNASSDSEFDRAVADVCDYMQRRNWEPDQWKNLDKLSYYQKNEYSDDANNEAISVAKTRVISYLEELMQNTKPSNEIIDILERFYYFIESINEKTPHAKSTLRKEYTYYNLSAHILINTDKKKAASAFFFMCRYLLVGCWKSYIEYGMIKIIIYF